MNGIVRSTKVRALRSKTVFGVGDGTRHDITKGDELTGFINEYGNFYTEDESYVGSTPLDFEEIEQDPG